MSAGRRGFSQTSPGHERSRAPASDVRHSARHRARRRDPGQRRAGLLAEAHRARDRLRPGCARIDRDRPARPHLLHGYERVSLAADRSPGRAARGAQGGDRRNPGRDGRPRQQPGPGLRQQQHGRGCRQRERRPHAGRSRYRRDDRDHHPGARHVERNHAWSRRGVLRVERLRARHRPVLRRPGDRQLVHGGDAQRARDRQHRPLPVRRADVQAGLDRPDRPHHGNLDDVRGGRPQPTSRPAPTA